MVAPPIVELVSGKAPNSPQFWLDAAQQAVRNYCGWHVSPAIDETLTITARGPRTLFLPTGKINDLTLVMNDGVDVTESVQVDETGYLYIEGGCWSLKLGGVVITMNHGYSLDEVSDLAGVIARLASRASASSANVTAQRAGGMSVNYATVDGLPAGTGLLISEKAELDAYRVVVY